MASQFLVCVQSGGHALDAALQQKRPVGFFRDTGYDDGI